MKCHNVINSTTRYSFAFLAPTIRENLKDRLDFDQSPLKRCSKEAQDFVKALLRTEPTKRLTPDEALEHPWFKSKTSRNVKLSSDVVASLAKEENEGEFKRIARGVSGRRIACGLCTSCYKVVLYGPTHKLSHLQIIASFASPDEIAEVRKLFEALDTDHSGYLTYEQFTVGLKEKFSDEKLDKLFLTMVSNFTLVFAALLFFWCLKQHVCTHQPKHINRNLLI
jgi:serine/threonine protein kinase